MRSIPGILACFCALAGCDRPAVEHRLSFPSYGELLGDAPSDDQLPDDVKADAPLPRRYLELLAEQSPVRDQGSRGVCTIFTSTALLEHTLFKAGKTDVDLSEQFLQWSHKREGAMLDPVESSALGNVMETLATRGTVAEALWPYEPERWSAPEHPACDEPVEHRPVDCITHGTPPAAALAASREKLPLGRYLRSSAIKDYLYTQRSPVAVGLEFIASAWSYPPDVYKDRPGAWARGEVPFPSARERMDAAAMGRLGHAVLIVGWDDEHEVPVLGDDGKPLVDAQGAPVVERGFYLFKNSWGTDYWGADNPHAPGYGLISQRYVAEFGRAYVVGLPSGAPPPAGGELHLGSSGLPLPAQGRIEDRISVPVGGPLAKASIELAIEHPQPSELTVELMHDAITWTLWRNGAGASSGIYGTWRIDDLERTDRGGDWILVVTDSTAGHAGTLQHWSIRFE